MPQRILIVEDDRKLAPLVQRYLEDHHFEVAWAADGDQGWRDYQRLSPDLVLLDLMLPGRDGLTLCKQIRAQGGTAVVILTAKGDETDRVVGLELGADDYVSKPFGLAELLARVRAVLRRCSPSEDQPASLRRIGPFTLDLDGRALSRGELAIELTRSEFDILERVTRSQGRVFSREELLEAMRDGETEAFDRAVDRHISNLRAKIERDPKNPEHLSTVWGVGYRWEKD